MIIPSRDIEALRRCLERWQQHDAEPDYDTFAAIFGPHAQDYWLVMCESYDWHNAPEEFSSGPPHVLVHY